MTYSWYTDAEIDNLCDPLTTSAAQIRYLRSLGITVNRKPNGRPLVIRAHAEAVLAGLQQLQGQVSGGQAATGARPNKAAMVLRFQRKTEVA